MINFNSLMRYNNPMNCIAINVGSSTIKLGIYERQDNTIVKKEHIVIDAQNEELLNTIQKYINSYELGDSFQFGIRVVHGGPFYTTPTRITDEVLTQLKSLSILAPLHNPPALNIIELLHKTFPLIPITAAFDTMFHAQMPDKATQYAISEEISHDLHIKRYGFHGLAYSSSLSKYADFIQTPKEEISLIALHLGSGCSISAIQKGKSVETSMGFSPLEGLISRTRTGDIDATIVAYIHEKTGQSIESIINILNKESGLKGLSNTDGHLQSLVHSTSEHHKKALDMFIYRIQKYIGAYDVVLNGQYPIVLSGGISEHSKEVIQSIFGNKYLDVEIDKTYQITHSVTKITTSTSKRQAYIVCIDEEYEIAKLVMTH